MGYSSSHPAPRARPVADLPLDELTGAGEELARSWAVAMIVARPPTAIAEIPLEDLVRDGPRLCAQVLRALQSDAELERLTQTAGDGGSEGPALAATLASLAGAGDAPSVVAAMEALRGVLWEALLGELRRPLLERADTHLLADLADRLAYVCAMALTAALSATVRPSPYQPRHREVFVAQTEGLSKPRGEPMAPAAPTGGGDVVIIDERQHAASASATVVARGASTTQEAERPAERTFAWSPPQATQPGSRQEPSLQDLSYPPPASGSAPGHERSEPDGDPRAAPPLGAPAEIHIRDERVEEGPAAWIRSIGRELERFALDGRPFAVLLIELMDAERLNRSEPPEEVLRVADQVQRTLEADLSTLSDRADASLTREAHGRLWLLAPGFDALRVGALAEQIAHAVRRSVTHRGQPVEIAVGTAVCPGDGVQAAALAAHADVALYAARAEGSAGGGPAR